MYTCANCSVLACASEDRTRNPGQLSHERSGGSGRDFKGLSGAGES